MVIVAIFVKPGRESEDACSSGERVGDRRAARDDEAGDVFAADVGVVRDRGHSEVALVVVDGVEGEGFDLDEEIVGAWGRGGAGGGCEGGGGGGEHGGLVGGRHLELSSWGGCFGRVVCRVVVVDAPFYVLLLGGGCGTSLGLIDAKPLVVFEVAGPL